MRHPIISVVLLTLLGPLLVGAVMAVRGGLGAFAMVAACIVVGPPVGLFSSAPYFTLQLKLLLGCGLLLSALAIYLGVRGRERLWGKLLLPLGGAAWTVCGALGFGPQ